MIFILDNCTTECTNSFGAFFKNGNKRCFSFGNQSLLFEQCAKETLLDVFIESGVLIRVVVSHLKGMTVILGKHDKLFCCDYPD